LKNGEYKCFLNHDTKLPMMYMDDAIKATIQLMEADSDRLKIRYGYNLAAMSFTPEDVAAEIQNHIPGFKISYEQDFREAIARSWTESIDDTKAREDWDWKPDYDLALMTTDMLYHLRAKYNL